MRTVWLRNGAIFLVTMAVYFVGANRIGIYLFSWSMEAFDSPTWTSGVRLIIGYFGAILIHPSMILILIFAPLRWIGLPINQTERFLYFIDGILWAVFITFSCSWILNRRAHNIGYSGPRHQGVVR